MNKICKYSKKGKNKENSDNNHFDVFRSDGKDRSD